MRSHRKCLKLHATLILSVLLVAACGGGSDGNHSATNASAPPPPPDPTFVDNAPIPDVPAFVDNIATNQRGDARFAALNTNAGVRLVSRFLDIWSPLTEIVDAGVSAP